MRLLICGGRDFFDAEYGVPRFERVHTKTPISTVISGMAKGADTMGAEWAKLSGIKLDEYWAEWKRYGASAGPIRNERMLKEGKPDLVLGLPGGTGTAHMCRISRAAGVPVIEYEKKHFSRARDAEWGWCSNFWPTEQFDDEGRRYKTNEHFYQAEKALDPADRQWIMESPDASTAKARGNDDSFDLRPDWNTYKIEAMIRGLRMKFKTGSELADRLIATGDLYLIEYAPWGDSFWGVDKTYKGENWLGRLLMRRRDELTAA